MSDRILVKSMCVAAVVLVVVAFCSKAEAAKNCSIDNSASLTPLYNQTVINSTSIPTGSVVVFMGESNWFHIANEVRPRSDVTLVNGADGGCAIGGIARNRSDCWAKVPSNADVILLKPVNRDGGQSASAYAATLEADTRAALVQIDRNLNVSKVLLVSHHATPWATANSKQGEPYSWWSGPVMQSVTNNPPPGLEFEVINAGYLWANGSFPRGDGLEWSCDLFDPDGVHLAKPVGNQRAALEIDLLLDSAIGGSPPPDPDPPTSCEIRVANGDPNCRINWQGVCQCRG